MTPWLQRLARTYSKGHLVELRRGRKIKGTFEGFAVGVSDDFVMIHELTPNMDLKGYVILRIADVTGFRKLNRQDSFAHKVLKIKGIEAVPLPCIKMEDFTSLVRSANSHFPLISLHRELTKIETYVVGVVTNVTEKTITLKRMDPDAKWGKTSRYKIKDITRIECGNGYLESLAMVARQEGRI